ncbi:hypothetical protein [Nocardioides montaniterrae]
MDPIKWWAHAHAFAVTRNGQRRDQRGDVPGWVLITVMTITVGMALFAMARPMLTGMLRNALNSVK